MQLLKQFNGTGLQREKSLVDCVSESFVQLMKQGLIY